MPCPLGHRGWYSRGPCRTRLHYNRGHFLNMLIIMIIYIEIKTGSQVIRVFLQTLRRKCALQYEIHKAFFTCPSGTCSQCKC